jgi:predicted DNA-binding protein
VSSTYTIRIPREIKDRMRKINVEWSEEVRGFIEERVKHLELVKAIEEAGSRAEKRKAKVDSTILIRKDRER